MQGVERALQEAVGDDGVPAGGDDGEPHVGGAEVAFINIGGKGEAVISVAELKDADGDITVAAGDRLQATVMSTEGGIKLSRQLLRSALCCSAVGWAEAGLAATTN